MLKRENGKYKMRIMSKQNANKQNLYNIGLIKNIIGANLMDKSLGKHC